MVTTLSVIPFLSISPSLRLECQVLQQVDSSHVHIKAFRTVTCFPERKEVQGSFGDIGGSVPEHQNVVNITIKSVIQYFWFPRVYRSYV